MAFKQKKPTHMYRTDDYYFHTTKDIDHHEAKHAEYLHNMQEVVAYDRENKSAYFRWLAVNQRAKLAGEFTPPAPGALDARVVSLLLCAAEALTAQCVWARARGTDKRSQNHAKNTSQYNEQRWAAAGSQATHPFFHSVRYLNEVRPPPLPLGSATSTQTD